MGIQLAGAESTGSHDARGVAEDRSADRAIDTRGHDPRRSLEGAVPSSAARVHRPSPQSSEAAARKPARPTLPFDDDIMSELIDGDPAASYRRVMELTEVTVADEPLWRGRTSKPAPEVESPILLRQDGEQYEVPDIATLQRWIMERRVDPDDKFSSDGKTWIRSGDRADLAVFFAAIEQLETIELGDSRPHFGLMPPQRAHTTHDEEEDDHTVESMAARTEEVPITASAPLPPPLELPAHALLGELTGAGLDPDAPTPRPSERLDVADAPPDTRPRPQGARSTSPEGIRGADASTLRAVARNVKPPPPPPPSVSDVVSPTTLVAIVAFIIVVLIATIAWLADKPDEAPSKPVVLPAARATTAQPEPPRAVPLDAPEAMEAGAAASRDPAPVFEPRSAAPSEPQTAPSAGAVAPAPAPAPRAQAETTAIGGIVAGAEESLARGDNTTAAARARAALAIDATSARAHFVLGATYAAADDGPQARAHLCAATGRLDTTEESRARAILTALKLSCAASAAP